MDQHTRDDKRRLTNEENVVYREDCCDGRNEARKEGGDNDWTGKSKSFGTVSTTTTETRKDKEEATLEATVSS